MEEAVLTFEGKPLIDTYPISKYKIGRNLTLSMTIRLIGGVAEKWASSSSKPTFREVVRKKSIPVHPTELKPEEYIVEQAKQTPYVEMQDPSIQEIYKNYSRKSYNL